MIYSALRTPLHAFSNHLAEQHGLGVLKAVLANCTPAKVNECCWRFQLTSSRNATCQRSCCGEGKSSLALLGPTV